MASAKIHVFMARKKMYSVCVSNWIDGKGCWTWNERIYLDTVEHLSKVKTDELLWLKKCGALKLM